MFIRQSKRPIVSEAFARLLMAMANDETPTPIVPGDYRCRLLKETVPSLSPSSTYDDISPHNANFSGHGSVIPVFVQPVNIASNMDGLAATVQFALSAADPLVTNTVVGYVLSLSGAEEMAVMTEVWTAPDHVPMLAVGDRIALTLLLPFHQTPVVV